MTSILFVQDFFFFEKSQCVAKRQQGGWKVIVQMVSDLN
jgi:hypothetical protein